MFLRRRGGPPRPRALRALAAALVGAGLVALACRPYRPADLSTIAEPRLLVDPGQELAWPELPIFGEGAGAPDDAASEAAVVIDLSEYRELPPRAGGERNADAWVQYFADVRGIPPQRLFALRGAQANPDRILAAVQSAGDLTGKDGRLWIIFIGHGATDLETSEGFLLTFGSPSDAPLDRRHALLVRALTGDLIDWVPSPPIVVLDACAPPELGLGAAAIGGVEPILEGPGTEPVLVFIVGGHILVAGGPEYDRSVP